MKHKSRFEQISITNLVSTFYHKGYRGAFTMKRTGKQVITGTLRDCLASCFTGVDSEADLKPFELSTKLPYNNVDCLFQVKLDYTNGFVIAEATFMQVKTSESKRYQIRDNNQIPGTKMAAGLFPKSKPWDSHKRKFRS